MMPRSLQRCSDRRAYHAHRNSTLFVTLPSLFRLSPAAPPALSEGRTPQPCRVDGEAQAEADEPRVVVQAGPGGWDLPLRHGGEEPGEPGRNNGGEGDEGGNGRDP